MTEQLAFQLVKSGLIPTSPLQLFIRPISKETAGICYRKWHYFGDKGFLSSFSYGVYFDDEILGAISYGIPNARNIKGLYTEDTQGEWLELTRLALSEKCPKNSGE